MAEHGHEELFDKQGFRLRGTKMERIDAFSDVVFGFALTLLVVSLEVPKTYTELHHSLRGFVPFGISFLFLMMVWHAHYKYFRRYATHDFMTIVINATLLFVVLFYVYPLKFLFTFLFSAFTGGGDGFFEAPSQVRELMFLFAMGYASIYLLVGALYWNAYKQREHLHLTPLERSLTRGYIEDSLGVAAIGLFAGLLAWVMPLHVLALAGWTYILIWPFKEFHGRLIRKRALPFRAPAAGAAKGAA